MEPKLSSILLKNSIEIINPRFKTIAIPNQTIPHCFLKSFAPDSIGDRIYIKVLAVFKSAAL